MTKPIQNPTSEIQNHWLAWAGAALWILVAAASSRAQPEPSPAEMLPDAELTAVAFVNADRGWAVGDRGAIWHTADGGRSWKLQSSGVTCRLEAVQFLDANNGWAAGGWTQPYTHQTHGVILRTRDGGKTWQNTPGLTLPGLTHLKFLDARQGWSVGSGSALFPSGVFFTDDGGRSWSPVMKGESPGWASADFTSEKSGLVAGLDGSLALVTRGELKPTRTPNLGARYLRRLLIAGTKPGPGEPDGTSTREAPGASLLPAKGGGECAWLVGDGGLVLATHDGGFTWNPPGGALPRVAADFDFRALSVHGTHVWIAGAPGTCVLHSPDSGQSWQLCRTEHTAPIRGLTFIDEYRGWAVGSLGTILHTRDGGQSWRVQRSGGSRVALLGVFSTPERVPLEIFAQQSGSDAYLSAVEILGRRDLEGAAPAPSDRAAPERTHAAVIAAGASQADTAWRFPLREAALPQTTDTVLARWNAANAAQAAARLEEHLVRRIRQWQPEVIVTEDVSPRGDNPLAHLTSQMTLAAAQKAGDLTAYPEQVTDAGLLPWKVKKVLTVLPEGKQGLVNITPAQWSPRLGRSLSDVAESGRGLILEDVAAGPRNIGLSLLVDHLPQATGRRDVMSGITIQPGSEARRQLASPPTGDLEQLSKLAQKRHNVEQLLARVASDANVGNWLGQVDDLTRGLSPRQSGEVLWQLAQRNVQAGRGESAAEAVQLLLERYPQHPLADRAALWLVQYYASGEAAWRERQRTKSSVQLTAAVADPAQVRSASEASEPSQATAAQFASFGHTNLGSSDGNSAQRAGRAIALAKQLERTRPVLYADPALRFPLAAALRASSLSPSGRGAGGEGSQRVLSGLPPFAPTNPWSANVAAAEWLTTPQATAPKKLLSVVTIRDKPTLDGKLDEPLWQAAKSVSLTGATGGPGDLATAAVLAFDDEFLYIAVSCRKAPGGQYAAGDKPRVPDEDLSRTDHCTLLLDIDRDYATWWQLSFDHRGRPAESCCGDASWNPQWFLASGGDEQFWTIEAAIPLTELAGRKPAVRDVWAAGIQRVIPHHGLQSFAHPAAIDIRPEGFALLVFE